MAVLVLNFGSQYAHLIARRVRELGAYSEIMPHDATVEEIAAKKPLALILSGGPSSVYEPQAPKCDAQIFSLGVPALGICYGHQLMAQELGGSVEGGHKKEFGKAVLRVNGAPTPLFQGLQEEEAVWFSHGDEVKLLPKGFQKTASTETCENAAMADEQKKLYGIQFHPEVMHTPCGKRVLSNFLCEIAKIEPAWRVDKNIGGKIEELQKQVGGEKAIIGVSGGIDSLVAATLLHKGIGSQLHCVFIDHGLLRKNEAMEVLSVLNKQGFANVHFVDASKDFLGALAGVTDPEEKRKIIGHKFIEVFEKAAREVEESEHIRFFAQGTIYPDRIESAQASKQAAKIKSHHNLTLPEKMNFQVIEPLAEYYKDEVRSLGRALGLSPEEVGRHPFPGPGLAIRILGEITDERLRILREADFIFIEELKRSNFYDKVGQAFAALLPVKSVGVMGDARTYEYMIALRCVDTSDFMTADWSKLPHELLEKVSNRIVNEVRGVNRVLYDVTQKPPGTIEYL